MMTLDGGRIGIASQTLGLAQGALDEAVQYVKKKAIQEELCLNSKIQHSN